MRERILAGLLALCLLFTLAAPASAANDGWKTWSQADPRWGKLSISSEGLERYTMKAQGCLITAIAKVLIYSGQQSAENFTPADCLEGMLKYELLNATGALTGGYRMNETGFLAEYGPQLYYGTDLSHDPWSEEMAYARIAEKIQDNCYVIVRTFNQESFSYHFMAVDHLADGKIYVMDNQQILDLYDTGKYNGVSDWLYFHSSGQGMPPVTNTTPPTTGLLNNFSVQNTYQDGIFSDVSENHWYRDGIARSYELGLVQGMGDGSFGVKSKFNVAAALALAARMHATYTGAENKFTQGTPWYQVYVDYDVRAGIISKGQFGDCSRPATRAEMAEIFSDALPDAALQRINSVPDGAIPDVPMSAPYAGAVYRLYRAGILTGDVGTGAFRPDADISRAEAVCLAARVADLDLRQNVELR